MNSRYRLVYMLATKADNSNFDPLLEHGEFVNRAAAKEYVMGKTFEEDIFLIRKETSIFYDRKLVDVS